MPRPRAQKPKFSLARRGSRYYVQWWEGGSARRISCRTEIATEARRFLAEFIAGRETVAPPPAPTIGQILDGFLDDRKEKVHSNSITYDCSTLKRHFGDLPADLLGTQQVRDYLRMRRRNGAGGAAAAYRKKPRELSDGTLIRELGTLRAALAWGVRQKWIAVAPYVERPEAPPPRDRWLTRKEAECLLNSAASPHIRLFIALALYTAARTGAILELEWEQVDIEGEIITLGRGRGRKRRATVPIVADLKLELLQAANAATISRVIAYRGRDVASIKQGFYAAARRANLPGITPHILRHTAATWMVQRGVPFEMVAKFLGNSKEMVERVYGHHSPEWLRLAANALSRQVAEKTVSQAT
jgi:integrase